VSPPWHSLALALAKGKEVYGTYLGRTVEGRLSGIDVGCGGASLEYISVIGGGGRGFIIYYLFILFYFIFIFILLAGDADETVSRYTAFDIHV